MSNEELLQLNESDRIEIARILGDRLSLAFTAFTYAATAHQAAFHRQKADKSEMTNLIAEVALGALTPGLLVQIGALALPLANYLKNINTSKSDEHDRYIREFKSLEDSEVKDLLLGATCSSESTTALYGETEVDDYIGNLTNQVHCQISDILDKLGDLSDAQLGLLYSITDPSVANFDTYKSLIGSLLSKYETEVESILSKGMNQFINPKTGYVCLVHFAGSKTESWSERRKKSRQYKGYEGNFASNNGRLTLVKGPEELHSYVMETRPYGAHRGVRGWGRWVSRDEGWQEFNEIFGNFLLTYQADISEEMAELAINKSHRLGYNVLSVLDTQVKNYPSEQLTGDEILFGPQIGGEIDELRRYVHRRIAVY